MKLQCNYNVAACITYNFMNIVCLFAEWDEVPSDDEDEVMREDESRCVSL